MTASASTFIGWLFTLLLPALTYWHLQPNLPPAATMLLTLMVAAAVQWTFRLVPDFVTGLMLLSLCALFGLVPPAMAFSGFTSSVFFLVLGVFLLSALLAQSVLIPRLSYWILHLSRNKPANSIYAVFLTALALTLAMPSPLGRSAVLAPLFKPLSERRSNNFRTGLLFVMAQGSTLLSTVFLTGNPLNFVLLGFLDNQTNQRFQWLYWLYATSAFALTVIVGMVLLLMWMLYQKEVPDDARVVSQIDDSLPALTWWDGVVVSLYVILFVAIFTRQVHQIELHWILITLALVGYYLLPMPMQAVRAKVDWPSLLFIASIVSWQAMLHHVGIDAWLMANSPMLLQFAHASLVVNIVSLAVLVGLVRLVMPSAPAFVILLTMFLPIAGYMGMSGWVLGFVLLTMSEAFIFPHQHGVLSYLCSEAQVTHLSFDKKRLLTVNAFAWLLRLLAVISCIPLWQHLSLI